MRALGLALFSEPSHSDRSSRPSRGAVVRGAEKVPASWRVRGRIIATPTCFILQQILEPGGHLLLTDTGEDVTAHPGFRLVATANTLGFGCDSGLYASGTNVLNFSWLDRWDVVVHLDYLAPEQEINLLKELGEDCADDGVYEFLFCAPPLHLPGGAGSPINPQAIK